MNTKHISLAFAAAVALLAGCAKSPIETPSGTNGLTDLELSHVGAIESKAVIDGTTFPEEGEIGLFLFKDEMATQDYGDGYKDIKYSYNSSKSRWTASPSIKVGSTPGYLYGYYPYSVTATNIKEIPVSSSLNGDDVMYASPQAEPITDATAANTAITMNHALARVSIKVINNGYTGAAMLSKIKFSGAKIAQEGTLNALDGSITATRSDDVTLDVTGDAQTITVAGTTYECLLVPSGENDNKQTVTLALTIDGEDKTATLSGDNGVIIAQNTKSNITITLSNKGISVQTVSVEDWNVVEVGGHKMTVKLADDIPVGNVIFGIYVEGLSVKIIAFPIVNQGLICNISGSANCDRIRDYRDIHTFTISEIQSDITATIESAPLPPGALKGVFTVADDGKGNTKKVHFSQGNLYYDGSLNAFKFETNQYDYHTYDSDSNTWGLFGWSTSSSNYGMSTSDSSSGYSGDFVDWGNAIDGSIWSTLTGGEYGEWKYLFDHHVNIWGTCNSMPGQFIAPDNFVGGTSALSSIISNWESAQAAGIVFLPAAGRRDGSDVNDVGDHGYYWSTSASSNNFAYCAYFLSSYVIPNYGGPRKSGYCVRLVTEVK